MPKNTNAIGGSKATGVRGTRDNYARTGKQANDPAASPANIGMDNTANLSTPNQTRKSK